MFSNIPNAGSRLVRAGLFTGISDGLFSSILSVAFYRSTATRLFQGVAATLLGPIATDGGTRTAAIGLLMHFGVAFGWSTVLLTLLSASERLRSIARTTSGRLRIAAVYGPFIWLVMSLAVIPLLLHRPPSITYRWWIQVIGHIPFVAWPMVTALSRPSFDRATT